MVGFFSLLTNSRKGLYSNPIYKIVKQHKAGERICVSRRVLESLINIAVTDALFNFEKALERYHYMKYGEFMGKVFC